jgi:two-component system OmpR family response regulator
MSSCASDDRKAVRVLVVDDYAPMADHLAKAIGTEEYTAMAVYSAEEALRAAEEFSPQALIADVMMPGMNGPELVCAFAKKFPGCRAMLMTANQWLPEIFIRGLRIKVLQKPFGLEEIFGFLSTCRSRAA